MSVHICCEGRMPSWSMQRQSAGVRCQPPAACSACSASTYMEPLMPGSRRGPPGGNGAPAALSSSPSQYQPWNWRSAHAPLRSAPL